MIMATDLRGIEGLLASRIGLDPASVGSPLILRGDNTNGRAGDRRPGCL